MTPGKAYLRLYVVHGWYSRGVVAARSKAHAAELASERDGPLKRMRVEAGPGDPPHTADDVETITPNRVTGPPGVLFTHSE